MSHPPGWARALQHSVVALLRMARGADLWGDSGFPFVTLTDYAVDTDSLRNPGAAPLRTFLLAKLFSKFHEGSVSACVFLTCAKISLSD